jgi:hypothetical protein
MAQSDSTADSTVPPTIEDTGVTLVEGSGGGDGDGGVGVDVDTGSFILRQGDRVETTVVPMAQLPQLLTQALADNSLVVDGIRLPFPVNPAVFDNAEDSRRRFASFDAALSTALSEVRLHSPSLSSISCLAHALAAWTSCGVCVCGVRGGLCACASCVYACAR